MKQKMTRFLNHENLENQLILLRKNHMISSNLPTKIREEPFFVMNGTIVEAKGYFNGHGNNGVWKGMIDGGGPVTLTTRSNGKSITGTLAWQARESQIGFGRMYNTRD